MSDKQAKFKRMRGGNGSGEPREKSRRVLTVCFTFPTIGKIKIWMSRVQVAKKLNILCLHGYFQDAAIMKDRTPSLFRKLKSIANFCNSHEKQLMSRLSGWTYSCELHGGV